MTPLSWGLSLLFGFFLHLFLPAWPTEHCCLFDQWRMAYASSEETKQTTHSPAFLLVPLPHSLRKQVLQPAVNTLYHAAFSLMAERKAAAPQRLCVNDSRGERLQRSFAPRSKEYEEEDERGPLGPCWPPGCPAAEPWKGPFSCVAQSQLAFIIGDINLHMQWRCNEEWRLSSMHVITAKESFFVVWTELFSWGVAASSVCVYTSVPGAAQDTSLRAKWDQTDPD